MKQLSDFKNGDAIDLLADILDPAVEIMSDEEITNKLFGKGERLEGIKLLITKHKQAVIEILAAMDGKKPDEYEFGFFALPMRLLEIVNDEELLSFFTDQQAQSTETASGLHMENTEESEA